ncbi:MAG: PQQ-binding-like beta-propeller repeat protein [Fimbriiglobus sp.]
MRRYTLIFFFLVLLAGGGVWWVWPEPSTPAPLTVAWKPLWVHESLDMGGFLARPEVSGENVYGITVLARGLRLAGSVECLDLAGKPVWKFDNNRAMKPSVSGVVRYQDKLYFGEGMHASFLSQFYCLDANTGTKRWSIETLDHIESTPVIHDNRIYFTAGNDGLHVLNPETGHRLGHFLAELHFDCQPCVTPKRVVIGSGPSRKFTTLAVVALETKSLQPVWRVPVTLPAWGSPSAADGRVFVGLGNGRMTTPAVPPTPPAGALLCLDEATGEERWQNRYPDAIFQKPTLHDGNVYFGCRDGHLRAVTQARGELLWETHLGSAIIAPPSLAGDDLYAMTLTGRLCHINMKTGEVKRDYDFSRETQMTGLAIGSPTIVGDRVYVTLELENPGGRIATLAAFPR